MTSLRFTGVSYPDLTGTRSLLLTNGTRPGQRFEGYDLDLLFRMYPGKRFTILIDIESAPEGEDPCSP